MEPSVKVFSSNYWIKDNFIVSDLDTVYATFVLKHDHAATVHFEKDIMERSTPSAPTYGQWLSQEKIIHKIAPAPGAVQKVVDFIVSHGVSQDAVKVSTFRDVVRAAIPAQIAERMFETEFARFRSESQRNVNILRITRPYSLPEDIAPLVAIVDDILRFPAVEGPLMSFDAEPTDTTIYSMDGEAFTKCGEACNGYTTPAVVEKAYKMTTPTTSAEANSGIAVTEFQREAGSASALGDFNKACGSGANAGESVRSVVTGGIGSTGPCSVSYFVFLFFISISHRYLFSFLLLFYAEPVLLRGADGCSVHLCPGGAHPRDRLVRPVLFPAGLAGRPHVHEGPPLGGLRELQLGLQRTALPGVHDCCIDTVPEGSCLGHLVGLRGWRQWRVGL